MSTPKSLDHLVPLAEAPDLEFDAFWTALQAANPDLATPGKLTMPVASFRSMMKFAFVAGKVATAEQLFSE